MSKKQKEPKEIKGLPPLNVAQIGPYDNIINAIRASGYPANRSNFASIAVKSFVDENGVKVENYIESFKRMRGEVELERAKAKVAALEAENSEV